MVEVLAHCSIVGPGLYCHRQEAACCRVPSAPSVGADGAHRLRPLRGPRSGLFRLCRVGPTGLPEHGAELDGAEQQAIGVLAEAGMVPPLRLVVDDRLREHDDETVPGNLPGARSAG